MHKCSRGHLVNAKQQCIQVTMHVYLYLFTSNWPRGTHTVETPLCIEVTPSSIPSVTTDEFIKAISL